MATDSTEATAADQQARARFVTRLAISTLIFGTAALPMWLLYQEIGGQLVLAVAIVVTIATAVTLAVEFVIAAFPQTARFFR